MIVLWSCRQVSLETLHKPLFWPGCPNFSAQVVKYGRKCPPPRPVHSSFGSLQPLVSPSVEIICLIKILLRGVKGKWKREHLITNYSDCLSSYSSRDFPGELHGSGTFHFSEMKLNCAESFRLPCQLLALWILYFTSKISGTVLALLSFSFKYRLATKFC